MDPVACGRCGTTVLVSKFSAEQTSIQWQDDAARCPLRAGREVGDSCPSLAESIQQAVLSGALGVSLREQ